MCRSTENSEFPFYPRDRDRLKIKTFHLRFSISAATRKLPETLTLIYLPQAGGGPLEVDGAKIRAGAPAFVALDRVRFGAAGEAAFASADRVRVADGARFEAYVGAERVVVGVFRLRRGGWGVECRAANEVDSGKLGLVEGEITVAGEGSVFLREKVRFEKNRRMREKRRFCSKLEEIPEEGEGEVDCCCCCCYDEDWEMVGNFEEEDGGGGLELEMEIEGVKWAVDMGIWAVCLGVGFLVSRASYKGLRRKII